jgi:integrase
MASLRKRKDNGHYFLDYRDIDRERYRPDTGTGDIKVAKVWLKVLEERLSLARLGVIEKVGELTIEAVRGISPPPEKQKRLSELKAIIRDRYQYDLDFSASTIELAGNAFDSLSGAIGNLPINDVNEELIRAWKRQLINQGKSKTTVSVYQRTLRAAFARAVKWDLVESNPLDDIELPRTESSRHPLTLDEVNRLLDSVQDAWFLNYIKFLLFTGCRRNEILYLRTKDVDTDRWILSVKAEKTGRELNLPINTALQETIRNMNLDKELVFESRMNPGRPWNSDGVTHKFKRAIRLAGLSESYSLHSLRHTYATHLQAKGVPRDIVQKLLGHTSPVTTSFYDHSEALHFRDYADKMDLNP